MRLQTNIVAIRERRLLDWIITLTPASVTSNHFSALGMLGAVVAFVGYAASTVAPGFLWLASLGLVMHWFGDSMDGGLARARNVARPLFGHFLDHSIDALGNSLIMLGLGTCLYVRMDVALAALAGYLLMTIHVLLKEHAMGVFQLSFLAAGPTELRICLILMNTSMWLWGATTVSIGGYLFTPYDILVAFAAIVFGALFVAHTASVARQVAEIDPPRQPITKA